MSSEKDDLSVAIGQRLREERERMGLNQEPFGVLGGVTKKTQGLYEAGERSPSAVYLSALAVHDLDVGYVLTGNRRARVAEQKRATYGAPRDDVWITVLEVVVDELNQRGKRLSGRKLVELVDLLADYAIKADGGVDEGFVERQIRLVA